MTRTDAIIIGGGQAGLAMSRCLTARGVEHVVLERGRIAERWRSERWDALTLLTPNWMSRLPGWRYPGPDPDGFMTMPEVIDFLEGYARSFAAPVLSGTTVEHVSRVGNRYTVVTSRGVFQAQCVVIATGHCGEPAIPSFAGELPETIRQVVPSAYRNPDALPAGGVLIVGASATGIQIADEIHRTGRPVTLAVGRHTRVPRTYRGRDIMHWLDRIGSLDERWDAVADLEAARRQPSLQLAGRMDRLPIDLGTLKSIGVRLVGRAETADAGTMRFAGDLMRRVARAEARLYRLIGRIDACIEAAGNAGAVPREKLRPLALDCPATGIDLKAEGISAVVWATGFRRTYGWLDVPVFDSAGEVRHAGGVTPAPGLYVIGLRFLRRRKSSFIDGVGPDAEELSDHLLQTLNGSARHAA